MALFRMYTNPFKPLYIIIIHSNGIITLINLIIWKLNVLFQKCKGVPCQWIRKQIDMINYVNLLYEENSCNKYK